MALEISGASQSLERKIRVVLDSAPFWYTEAARLSRIEVTNRPDVAAQIAMYEHNSRILYVVPRPPEMIFARALLHELAHGIDDSNGNPHFFSSSPEWVRIHQEQTQFDLPKYADEALEYFADMMAKFIMIGPDKLAMTQPKETKFLMGVARHIQQEEM